MKNIKIKIGKASVGINKEWLSGFKTEAEMIEKTKDIIATIPEPARTEALKAEWAKLQPKSEPAATTAKTETKKV